MSYTNVTQEQKHWSQWVCPLPASLGQLIIRVYDVNFAGGHSNALLSFSWKLGAFVRELVKTYAWSINLIPLKLRQLAVMFWVIHVLEKESVKKTKERTTKSDLAQAKRQPSGPYAACLCICVRVCICVCVSRGWLSPPPTHPNSPVRSWCQSHSAAFTVPNSSCLWFQTLAGIKISIQ